MRNALKISVVILSCLCACSCKPTTTETAFIINGKSDFYDGKELMVETYPAFIMDTGFTATRFTNLSSYPFNIFTVKNGKFQTKGDMSFPTPCIISFTKEDGQSGSLSTFFFPNQSGETNLTVDELSNSTVIKIDNNSESQIEFASILEDLKSFYVLEMDTILIKSQQAKLKNHIVQNPDSYVAMWLVYTHYQNTGYSPQLYENAHLFSKKIRDINIFKSMIEQMETQRTMAASALFPFDEFKQIAPTLQSEVSKNNFTLIDFWGTWCGPCIAQFPILKKLHTKFQPKGFNIISFSADEKEHKAKVDATLKKFGIPWSNFTDASAVNNKIGVTALPTNFLLDQQGNILFKNISVEDLAKYLSTH